MKFFKTLFIILLFGVTSSGYSQGLEQDSGADTDKQTIEITINNDRFTMNNVRPNTKVDVFSIIGTKVASIDVKSGYGDSNLNLPKGYYIIKADNTSRKIAIK